MNLKIKFALLLPLLLFVVGALLFGYTKLEHLLGVPSKTYSCNTGFLPCSYSATPGLKVSQGYWLALMMSSGYVPLAIQIYGLTKNIFIMIFYSYFVVGGLADVVLFLLGKKRTRGATSVSRK